jgi:hypothetical protein
MISLTLLTALASGSEPQWTTLFAEAGWSSVATPDTDETGPIDLRLKEISGTPCLRGDATVDATPAKLFEVIADIPAARQFSSEKLIAAQWLDTDGGPDRHYYQHLDVPGWTMASDRFWVLKGYPTSKGAVKSWRWERFDWRSAYPDLATSIDTDHAGAIEPQTNWGSWVFEPQENGKTLVRYYICSDVGGSLPDWLGKTLATKTLPGTMADVTREAQKRAGL